MWISLFTVVFAIALGFGLGAVMLESNGTDDPRTPARHW